MDAARARLGLAKTKSWNQRLQDTTFTKLQSFVKLKLQAMCECVEAFYILNISNVCKLFSLFVSGLQRGCAILAGRGFTLLARLNSTSMNIQIGAERPGRGRGASGASLSLTTGQGLSGPQFEVRPMKFVEYSAFAS